MQGISEEKKVKERIEILRDVIIFSESNEKILERLASSLIDVFVEKEIKARWKKKRTAIETRSAAEA